MLPVNELVAVPLCDVLNDANVNISLAVNDIIIVGNPILAEAKFLFANAAAADTSITVQK